LTVVVKVVPATRGVDVGRLAIAVKQPTGAKSTGGYAAALKSASSPVHVTQGGSVELKTWIYPPGATRIQGAWRSSNPAVATVNAVGRVTAVAKGKTTITCEVGTKKAHKTIIVG
jgi:hypothetical protein